MKNEINEQGLKIGIKELDKIAYNRLEATIEEGDVGKIRYAVQKAIETVEVASSAGLSARLTNDYLCYNGKQIKKKFGIDIPGYTS